MVGLAYTPRHIEDFTSIKTSRKLFGIAYAHMRWHLKLEGIAKLIGVSVVFSLQVDRMTMEKVGVISKGAGSRNEDDGVIVTKLHHIILFLLENNYYTIKHASLSFQRRKP